MIPVNSPQSPAPIALDFELPVLDAPLLPRSPANTTWSQWMRESAARTRHYFATRDPEADAKERLANKCPEPFIL
jgi:hypothetical protein